MTLYTVEMETVLGLRVQLGASTNKDLAYAYADVKRREWADDNIFEAPKIEVTAYEQDGDNDIIIFKK